MAAKVSLSSDSSSSIERSFGKINLLALKKLRSLRNQKQDELFDLSTTSDETSESASLSSPEESKLKFEGNKPLVLELHDITRTKPPVPPPVPPPAQAPPSAPAAAPEAARKKLRKKKKKTKEPKKQTSSSSPSDTSLCPRSDSNKDEFYDARESYHGIPSDVLKGPVALKSIISPTLKESPYQSERVPAGGVATKGGAEKAGALKKSPVTKPIVSPAIRDTPHSSVVAPVAPNVVASSAEQVATVKTDAAAKAPTTKTAITKPTDP